VVGQYLFWQKHDWESLASALITPLLITSVASILSIVLGDVRNIYTMIFIFSAWFTVIGNAAMMIDLLRKNAKLIGGALSHVGFGALLLGIIASSSFNEVMLDERGQNYNRMVEQGELMDEQGFPVTQKMEIFELKLNQPKVINNQYMVTYEGYRLTNSPRPGQQEYQIRFEPLDGGKEFIMYPEVYPMLTNSNSDNIEWSVDPDVRTLFHKDIYMYVAGSSYVDQRNQQLSRRQNIEAAAAGGVSQGVNQEGQQQTDVQDQELQKIEFMRQQPVEAGPFRFTFKDFSPASEEHLPDSTVIGVRSLIEVSHRASGEAFEVEPLFAVYTEEGQSWTYAPPLELEHWNLTLQFTRIIPEDDAIELTFHGLDEEYEEEWVVIVAEKKPFVSVIWIGTFLLMAGFTVSIFRHVGRGRKKKST